MKARRSRHIGHRFPVEIIRHVVWLYYPFSMSFLSALRPARRAHLTSYHDVPGSDLKHSPDTA
jgi:hypothetical protein